MNRAFITSTRTSRVLVSTLLADRQMPKILHDANLFDMDAKPSDHIEGLASVMLAGWHPWYHLIITFHSDGALQGSFATPDGGSQPALLQKDADRLLSTVKWPNALKVMAARSSIRPETAIESFDHHHKILDFRDLRRCEWACVRVFQVTLTPDLPSSAGQGSIKATCKPGSSARVSERSR